MYQLTRTVRFAVNDDPADQQISTHGNGHGGNPPLLGAGQYFELSVTLAGDLQPHSSYLINIKQVDRTVRDQVIPLFENAIRNGEFKAGGNVVLDTFDVLRHAFHPRIRITRTSLALTPFLHLTADEKDLPMIRLSQKFEFSASHRLHNPSLTDEENRATFGKCNNPQGHGHNYELMVTVAGEPDARGVVIPLPQLEQIVHEAVLTRFDHKNLNCELPEFATTIPSVENIARVIHGLLKPHFTRTAKLHSVTVWETPKTWCEYADPA